MVRGPRSGSEAGDRRLARKIAKMERYSHGGYAGLSIRETLQNDLLKACVKYLQAKEAVETLEMMNQDVSSKDRYNVGVTRGIVRGLAIALAGYIQPYQPRPKQVEQDFFAMAKQAIQESESDTDGGDV